MVNLRTAKIQILMLLYDRTPIDRFDVTGAFDFNEELRPLQAYRDIALTARPDLKAAMQNVDLAKITYDLAVANGSTDPTFTLWWTHNPFFLTTRTTTTPLAAASASHCGSSTRARTQVDISRNQRLRDAAEAQVFSDVDSAYYTLLQNVESAEAL